MIYPRIGDKVIIEGTVCRVDGDYAYFTTKFFRDGNESAKNYAIHISRIKEIISPPWEPKIGEIIAYSTAPNTPAEATDFRYKVLFITENRKFVVVTRADGSPEWPCTVNMAHLKRIV